jgi:hypothetical protein
VGVASLVARLAAAGWQTWNQPLFSKQIVAFWTQ